MDLHTANTESLFLNTNLVEAGRPNVLVSAAELLKVLRVLKNNSTKVYMRLVQDRIYFRSIDFKEGLGLLDVELVLKTPYAGTLDLSIEVEQVVKLLENFKDDVKLIFNLSENYLTITGGDLDPNKKYYISPYESSVKNSNLLDMALLPANFTDTSAYASFEINNTDLFELFKAITVVDNTICFLFVKSESGTISLNINAKKSTNLFQFTDEMQKSLRNVSTITEKVYNEYVIYYPYANYNPLLKLKDKTTIKVLFHQQYLILKSDTDGSCSYTLYLPLKSVKLL